MRERVYLRDWLYNAGIVGFIRIFEYNGKKDKVTIGDNYIEFSTEDLKDFHEMYFNLAYEKLDLYSRAAYETNNQKLLQNIKELMKKYKELRDDKNIQDALNKKDDEKLKNALYEHWKEYKDLYVKKYYLWNFYKGKSFLNPAVSKEEIKERFKKDFIESVESQSRASKITCRICNQRPAKKDTFFDEGAFKLSGASPKEYKNFYWRLKPNTHLCSICELIYLCSFAGFSNLKFIGESARYIFVNLDTNLEELYRINRTLEAFILNKDNPYKEAIRDIVLRFQEKRSMWSIQNILFIEFNTKEGASKIQHFHIPTYTAKLFTGKEYDSFSRLRGIEYRKKEGVSINILNRTIDHILEGVSLYGFLNEIIRDIISNPHGLHDSLSNGIYNFFEIVKIQSALNLYKLRREDMIKSAYDTIEKAYKEGKYLSRQLSKAGAKNKVDSIAYKLLSALRVKDIGSFYDTLLRLYINLERSIPKYFVEVLSLDSSIDIEALGYSFLIGFLSGQYIENKVNAEGGESHE